MPKPDIRCPTGPLARPIWLACTLAVLGATAVAQEQRPETDLIKPLRAVALGQVQSDAVEGDYAHAEALVCPAPRPADVESRLNMGWLNASASGVLRSELSAGSYSGPAAEQAFGQPQRMSGEVGPTSGNADGMRAPPAAQPRVVGPAAAKAAQTQFDITKSAPADIVGLVKKIAPEYRVEPGLVLTIMEIESKYDTIALSRKNAMGLMQLIPETAARFKVLDAYDAAQNIRGGTAYLRWLLAYFEGDVSLVAAAYNAGEGNVERYRGVPPFVERREYVRRVIASLGQIKHPFDPRVTQPSPFLRPVRDLRASR